MRSILGVGVMNKSLGYRLIQVGRKLFVGTPIQRLKITSVIYARIFHSMYPEGDAATEYLTDVRERDPIYTSEGLGHPGLVQRVMNRVLVDNAILGPWIHVGSRMQLLSAARSGDELTARAKVTGNYEKKGHRFVELDALVVANGRTPVAHCHHIAIYQPREQAAA